MVRVFRSLSPAVVLLVAGLALAACGGKGKTANDYKDTPVESLYNKAMNDMALSHWVDAVKGFAEVDREHPTSTWATKAQLMGAFADYQADKLDDAISLLNRYIQLHPGNQDAAYAYYLKAICYYEQISDVQRDQDSALQALKALQAVIDRFPNSAYAQDAKFRLNTVRDHLAGREMAVGRYYENNNQYLAALNRYRGVVDTFQTTSQVPEALYRLVECYVALGLSDEAARDAAVLGYNYPGSRWYQDAYELLKKASPTVVAKYSVPGAGLIPRLQEPTPASEPESNGRVGAPGTANEVPEPSAEIMKSANQPAAAPDAGKKDDDKDTGVSGAWSDFTKWIKGSL